MGNALKFLKEQEEKEQKREELERQKDVIKVHEDYCVVTKCPDSERNRDTKLAKYKLGHKDRNDFRVDSPYDGLKVRYKGGDYFVKQLHSTKVKLDGYSFKLSPLFSEFVALEFTERTLKTLITQNKIMILGA